MINVPFFTPVLHKESIFPSFRESIENGIENYFYLRGKQGVRETFGSKQKIEEVDMVNGSQSLTSTLIKISTYCTLIIPAIMLAAKFLFRRKHQFVYYAPILRLQTPTDLKLSMQNRMQGCRDSLSNNNPEITSGYGEYIVYRKEADIKKMPSQADFIAVQNLVRELCPVKNPLIKDKDQHYQILREKIQEIDPALEITFIPRSLYEIVFLNKCIQEDLKKNQLCINSGLKKYEPAKKNCLHICHYNEESGYVMDENAKKLQFRMNRILLKMTKHDSEKLTYHRICEIAQNQIKTLASIHISRQTDLSQKVLKIISGSITSVTNNFVVESNVGLFKPMGIDSLKTEEILKNSLALECSEIARKSLLFYRGGNISADRPYAGGPYSLSYGASLFSGALHDGGATAFHYMRQLKRDAYVLSVPFKMVAESPFYVKETNPIIQISSEGEMFHARSKIWKVSSETSVGGFMGICSRPYSKLDETLKINVNAETFFDSFSNYMAMGYLLK